MIVIEYLQEWGISSGVGGAIGSMLGYVIGRVHQHRIQSTICDEKETHDNA